MAICHWCRQPLEFQRGKGWVHRGGGVYVMRCDECGWTGSLHPSPVLCPRCGSKRIRDLHCALPEEEEG